MPLQPESLQPEIIVNPTPIVLWRVARPILYGVLGMTTGQRLRDLDGFVASVAGVAQNEVVRARTIGLANSVGELALDQDYQPVINPQSEAARQVADAPAFTTGTGVVVGREALQALVTVQQEIETRQAQLRQAITDLHARR